MTAWLWLILPVIALVIWAFRRRRHRDNDLGSVSVQWLQEHRRERHQDR
jgi:ABC-type spermidine/putrescine transport system permease subunit II